MDALVGEGPGQGRQGLERRAGGDDDAHGHQAVASEVGAARAEPRGVVGVRVQVTLECWEILENGVSMVSGASC